MVRLRGAAHRLRFIACFSACCVLGLPALGANNQSLIELPEKPVAPALRLKDLDGRLHDIRDYRGTVVVVNFWATWCAPCRKEMPSLQRAWTRFQKHGVALLAVSMGEPKEQVERFLRRYPVDFPILVAGTPTHKATWQLQGMPTTYVVDRHGTIHYGAIGERAWDDPVVLDQVISLTQ